MKVQEADRLGIPVYDYVPELKLATDEIVRNLNQKDPILRKV